MIRLPDFLAARLACLTAVLAGRDDVRHVTRGELVRSLVAWYGLHRRRIHRAAVVTPLNERLDWVHLGRYGVAWPRVYDRSRLVGAYIELTAPFNAHYYFSLPTPPPAPGSTVIDVGASEGAFALECLLHHGAARVWCFEPEDSMAEALHATAERNDLATRLQIVRAAVSDRSGRVRIVEQDGDPLASYCVAPAPGDAPRFGKEGGRTIPSVRLDEWAGHTAMDRVDFLKIDAEGSDFDVLRGAEDILRRWRPAIAVTTYHDPGHCNRMMDYLASLHLGYRFHVRGVIAFHGVARPVMLHAAAGDDTRAGARFAPNALSQPPTGL